MKEFLQYTLLILLLLCFNGLEAQQVLRLSSDDKPGKGSVSELNWLTGYWKGTGLGGVVEELWMPAVDNIMSGIFRLQRNDTIVFTEYMKFFEEEGSITLKIKHFNRDLSAWEDKENWVEFRLIKIESHTAYFSGITFSRKNEELKIRLNMMRRGEVEIIEFDFILSPLTSDS